MQAQAAKDLERMTRERLAAEGLLPEALTAFGGARRLTLVAEGLPAAQPDRHEERKGPRTNAPEQAIEGFLRSAGIAREALVEPGTQPRHRARQLVAAPRRLAEPEGDRRRHAMGVLDPDRAALDPLDAIGFVAELEDVAAHALHGEILVHRADDLVLRLQ